MEKNNLKSLKVGFIGGGNMATAIGAGLIRKGVLSPDNVWVSARTDRTLSFWSDLGAHTTLKNGLVIENCDIVFLAMKPHVLDEALNGIKFEGKIPNPLFISVLVGVSIETLHNKLVSVTPVPRIIRSMPNTPLMIGEGIIVYCSNKHVAEKDMDVVKTLFSYISVTETVPESLMNPIGGLSGSGPAYAYLVIEALADGAVKMGVPRPMATKFAAQVLIGAGKMVLETGKHPGQLKDEVCSAGGTTITGVHAMERGQVRASMMNAVEAAVNKSNELASKLK